MAKTSYSKIKRITDLVNTISGDFAEIGVYRGETFHHLVPLAIAQNKEAHAFDSFVGMNVPTEQDGPRQYRKGSHNVGGLDKFNQLMKNYGVQSNQYTTFEGYIPNCFESVKNEQKYSFVYLDVDQYLPTKISLPWIWEHLTSKGILMMDDFFAKKTILASSAINEWLPTVTYEEIELENTQLVIRKP